MAKTYSLLERAGQTQKVIGYTDDLMEARNWQYSVDDGSRGWGYAGKHTLENGWEN